MTIIYKHCLFAELAQAHPNMNHTKCRLLAAVQCADVCTNRAGIVLYTCAVHAHCTSYFQTIANTIGVSFQCVLIHLPGALLSYTYPTHPVTNQHEDKVQLCMYCTWNKLWRWTHIGLTYHKTKITLWHRCAYEKLVLYMTLHSITLPYFTVYCITIFPYITMQCVTLH